MLFFLLRSLIFFFWLKFDAMTKSVEDRGLYIQVVVCILNLEDQKIIIIIIVVVFFLLLLFF